jgi:hypothetical protein
MRICFMGPFQDNPRYLIATWPSATEVPRVGDKVELKARHASESGRPAIMIVKDVVWLDPKASQEFDVEVTVGYPRRFW